MAVAAFGGLTPLAGASAVEAGPTLVVAQDGSGDHVTISDAVAAAADGDTVLIAPGTYAEPVTIDKDITVTGDGPVEDVVISYSEADTPIVAILDADAVLSNLTLTGPDSLVLVVGGAPTLQGLHFVDVGITFDGQGSTCHSAFGPTDCNPVALQLDGTRAHVLDSTFDGSGEINVGGGASPLIEGNHASGRSHVFLGEVGAETVVRGNTITATEKGGVVAYTTGRPLIEGNTISDSHSTAITVGLQLAPGIEPIIRGNVISGNETGIQLAAGTMPTIEGNELVGNTSAIVINGADARISGNHIQDNPSGIFIMQGAPTLEDNVISGGKVGLGLGGRRAVPTLTGNTICDNETNVSLVMGAEMPDTAGNEVCPDDV
jgi:parallel beta-helix repeat protein